MCFIAIWHMKVWEKKERHAWLNILCDYPRAWTPEPHCWGSVLLGFQPSFHPGCLCNFLVSQFPQIYNGDWSTVPCMELLRGGNEPARGKQSAHHCTLVTWVDGDVIVDVFTQWASEHLPCWFAWCEDCHPCCLSLKLKSHTHIYMCTHIHILP